MDESAVFPISSIVKYAVYVAWCSFGEPGVEDSKIAQRRKGRRGALRGTRLDDFALR
jgi:hypothetical protein